MKVNDRACGKTTSKSDVAHYRGCLIGGAIGDALGYPIEFLSMNRIRNLYGEDGISDLVLNAEGEAEITDDTQMTMFTAEGILRALVRDREKGISHIPSVVYNAYLRWLLTQGMLKSDRKGLIRTGELIKLKSLFFQRAPGNSCLSALSSGEMGKIDYPINNSKGCGGVMRVAPIGLLKSIDNPFQIASECAAITHGHPSGYLAAGAFALIVRLIISGFCIKDAVLNALGELKSHSDHEECASAITLSLQLAEKKIVEEKAIKRIGEGWIAEEALAISIYCAIKHQDNFEDAIRAAVNHDGDSDSTGAITGNMVGAYVGIERIPSEWIEKLESHGIILQMGEDLFYQYDDTKEWWNRYPGY